MRHLIPVSLQVWVYEIDTSLTDRSSSSLVPSGRRPSSPRGRVGRHFGVPSTTKFPTYGFWVRYTDVRDPGVASCHCDRLLLTLWGPGPKRFPTLQRSMTLSLCLFFHFVDKLQPDFLLLPEVGRPFSFRCLWTSVQLPSCRTNRVQSVAPTLSPSSFRPVKRHVYEGWRGESVRTTRRTPYDRDKWPDSWSTLRSHHLHPDR